VITVAAAATVLLSHRLDSDQPNWPGAPGLTVRAWSRISGGEVANTGVVEIYTHYGTHCDLPFHFLDDGADMTALDHRDFIFDRPHLVDLPLAERELVTPAHLEPHAAGISGADLLLLRSGFERHRAADRHRYEHDGPGFTDEAARYLRQFPGLRGVALDWLSLCAVSDQEPGVAAHRTLLRADAAGRFVTIFEDVGMTALGGIAPTRVLALPLFIDGLDGSPCTIVAELPA
jgi:kynurenine formamidase